MDFYFANEDALIEYLKANLKLVTDTEYGYYGERGMEIKLMLDDKEISSVSIDFPRDPGSAY